MAIKLEEKIEEITEGTIKRIKETSSMFNNYEQTRYFFRDYSGKNLILKFDGLIRFDSHKNSAEKGDTITVYKIGETTKIEVRKKDSSDLRYTCYFPSSEVRIFK